jgi:hypothetical protein
VLKKELSNLKLSRKNIFNSEELEKIILEEEIIKKDIKNKSAMLNS